MHGKFKVKEGQRNKGSAHLMLLVPLEPMRGRSMVSRMVLAMGLKKWFYMQHSSCSLAQARQSCWQCRPVSMSGEAERRGSQEEVMTSSRRSCNASHCQLAGDHLQKVRWLYCSVGGSRALSFEDSAIAARVIAVRVQSGAAEAWRARAWDARGGIH